MFKIVYCRRKEIQAAGENGVARITMNRAVRNEATYFAIQLLMFFTSFWAIFKVKPDAPNSAIQFYFATLGVRALISIILIWSSWKDIGDRQELRIELDKLHPDTPPSLVK